MCALQLTLSGTVPSVPATAVLGARGTATGGVRGATTHAVHTIASKTKSAAPFDLHGDRRRADSGGGALRYGDIAPSLSHRGFLGAFTRVH